MNPKTIQELLQAFYPAQLPRLIGKNVEVACNWVKSTLWWLR